MVASVWVSQVWHSAEKRSKVALVGRADQGFAKEEDRGEHGARAYNGGLGSTPAGSRGRTPAGGQQGEAPLKLKASCPFSSKRGARR